MSTSKPNKQPNANAQPKPQANPNKPAKPNGLRIGSATISCAASPDGKTFQLRGLTDPITLSLDELRALSTFLNQVANANDMTIARNQKTDAILAAHLNQIQSSWAARGNQGGPDPMVELREGADGRFAIQFRDRAEAAALLAVDWKIASDKVKAGAKPGRVTVAVVTRDMVEVRTPKTSDAPESAATPP